jgi:cyclin B
MYMQNQADINSKMRAILVDWLVDTHSKFKLVPATLYLTVSLLDRYCTSNAVPRSKLQLVGITALLVASKFEETYPPEVRDCIYMTDYAYTRKEVLDMESKLMVFFDYNVSSPTAHPFLERFLRVGGHDLASITAFRASYFSERCLQEHDMLSFRPSLVAAAAVYLAASMLRDVPWTEPLECCSGYTVEQLAPCARQMSEHVNQNTITSMQRPLHAAQKKFMVQKYLAVAKESPPVL